MEKRRIFIVGDSLFAETLTQLLGQEEAVNIVGMTSTLTGALPLLAACHPDVVIIARESSQPDAAFAHFLSIYPQLPVICLDLSSNDLQIIVSQHQIAHSSSDILAVITALPKLSGAGSCHT